MISLKQFAEKINNWRTVYFTNAIFIIIIFILWGFLAFGLGRLSKIYDSKGVIKISEKETIYSRLSSDISNELVYVASKNGKVYHLPWCPGASKIKEDNRIYFKSLQEAKSFGLLPASNCKGL